MADPTGLPDRWPSRAPAARWSSPLGTGWSSPVLGSGKVFVTDRQQDRERVLAFEAATGQVQWQQSHPVDFDPHPVGRRHGNGPKSTPVVAGSRVFALGIAGWLVCLSADDGRILWRRDLPADFGQPQPLPEQRALVRGTECVVVPIGGGQGAPVPLFGYTGSPIVENDLLVLSVGGARGGTLMAFDAQTGAVRWRGLSENVSYSSPVAATIHGRRQIVAMTGPRVVGLDAADGSLLWSHPFQIQYDESISTPAVAGELVLVTGDSRPLTALRIIPAGSGFRAVEAWSSDELSSYLSSMVVGGPCVYGMNDGGEFHCLRLADGQSLWRGGNHGYYANPVLAGRWLLALCEKGRLAVLEADPARYHQAAEYALCEAESWTMPALDNGCLYVRDGRGLACYDFGGQGPSR